MRIVGGVHKGRRLTVPSGDAVRPTTDRVREALFSMLTSGRYGGDRVRDARVLDAFAGSGALGLEALSRGAAHATFIDNAGTAAAAISANIALLGLDAQSRVIRADSTRPPPAPAASDLIFLDPPYHSESATAALVALSSAGWIAAHALVVLECDSRTEFTPPGGFAEVVSRRYGRTCLTFVQSA